MLLNVEISSNATNFESRVCVITNCNKKDLMQKTLAYLEDASNATYKIMKRNSDYVFQALEISENSRTEHSTK